MTAVSKDDFKAIMSSFGSGVTVVTTVDGAGKLSGITVSAFSSLSLDPPLCLVCIDKRAASSAALTESKKFAVNILSDQQEAVSNGFARSVADKFAEVNHEAGPVTGCPVLPEALAWMECEVTDITAGGDHDIFVGKLVNVQVNEGKPLLYWGGAYGDITSRPKSW
jgi:flavin reductase (DIM6/NTAB) family NADH-FMN oxidoreductase RutF